MMADEIIEMEARLKNFISTNVKTIQKDLNTMGVSGSDAFKKVDKGASTFMSTLKGFVGAQAIIGGVRKAWGTLINTGKEALELTKIQTQAETALASSLGFTSTALLQQASDLQAITTFGDEATIQAQALVAAFVREEDQITKLIPVIQDFAAAKGIGLKNAADLVTKTVASETNALSRYGIVVEGAAGSTERIDSAVKALETSFGGMAEALAETDPGQIIQLENTIGDLKETLGEDIIPLQIEWNKLRIEGLKTLLDTVAATKILLNLRDRDAEHVESIFQEVKELRQLRSEYEGIRDTQLALQAQKGSLFNAEALEEAQLNIETINEQLVELGAISKKIGSTRATDSDGDGDKDAAKEAKDRFKAGEKALAEYRSKQFADAKAEFEFKKKQADEEIKLEEEKRGQIIDAEKIFRDARIAAMDEEGAREIAALEAKYSDMLSAVEGNEDAITQILAAKKIERDTLINELDARSAEEQRERRISNFEKINFAAQDLGNSLIALSRQSRQQELSSEKARIAGLNVSEKKREELLKKAEKANKDAAKKEKAVALVQAGVNTGVAITKAWASAPNPIVGAVLAALVGAAGAVQIAAIASAKYQQGGIVPGNQFSGDSVPARVNSGELILNRQQQSELFRIAKGESTVTNNNQREVVINLQGSATQGDADMIVSTLMEAERDGNLDDFKLRILAA